MTSRVGDRLLVCALAALMVAAFTGCNVGPNYRRPAVNVPGTYRGPDGEAAPSQAASLGDEKWWEVFRDPQLQALIRTALERNYDLRIAATRVLAAQAQLGITRANLYPSASVGGNLAGQQQPQIGPVPAYQVTLGNVVASAGWNLDFWGRYRRGTEAARADLLANQWAQRQVMATLVSSVAASYFQLRQLDLELEIARRTLSSRQESLQLTRTLEAHGFNSLLDVRQSEQLVYTAAARVPDLERQIGQTENTISLLLGDNPAAIPRGLKLTEQTTPPEVPAGLPSALLARRPDILAAEQNLVAANARIGVARAAFFPQISLTGTAGLESPALSSLFTGPAELWTLAGSLTQPVFQGGVLKSNLRLARAQHEQLLLTYQETIQGAFRDVSDALIAYRKTREFRAQQELLFHSAQDAAHLSAVRFKAGSTDYLEVLTNETNAFSAELGLAQAQGNEILALVQLYQALGGGWQP